MGQETGREPCPFRILDDVGGAFCMGAIGGSMWHSVKGARNSPKGERIKVRVLLILSTRQPASLLLRPLHRLSYDHIVQGERTRELVHANAAQTSVYRRLCYDMLPSKSVS